MTRDDCLGADWYALGLEAGSEGQGRDRFDRQHEACLQHGIATDRAAWLEGYEYGLEDFCTPANGYDQGSRGQTYQGVCPSHLEGGFLLGYQQGRTLYDARQRVAGIENAMAERASLIRDTEYRIHRLQEVLAHRDTSDAERQQILANIRWLQRDILVLRRDISDLNHQHNNAVRHMQQVQQQGIQGW